jgi:hypothetical protein
MKQNLDLTNKSVLNESSTSVTVNVVYIGLKGWFHYECLSCVVSTLTHQLSTESISLFFDQLIDT